MDSAQRNNGLLTGIMLRFCRPAVNPIREVTVRALVFTAAHQVQVLDVDAPEATDTDVVVDVKAVGVCGSDLHGIAGTGWRQPPLVMGHEVAGLDPEGRRVAVNPLIPCGACDLCLLGQQNLCRHRQLLGVQRPGGFSHQVAVPRTALHVLPESLDWAAAALIEPLANAVHACRLAGNLAGGRVGVIGAGALGLLTTAVAALEAPDELSVADPFEHRLAVADGLGATTTSARLDGEYDVLIDAVGSAHTRAESLRLLRPGGQAVWLGLAEPEARLDGNALVRDEKRLTGSFAYSDTEFAAAVALAESVDLSWTTSVDLEDSAAVFLDLAAGRSDIVRAVIRPS